MSLPRIFHSTKLTLAPSNTHTYITRCLQSQEHFLDLHHMHWNEDLFLSIAEKDTNNEWYVPHAKKLIHYKAWAIISDFLRLYALYTHGGIYADWDVEFLQCISENMPKDITEDIPEDIPKNQWKAIFDENCEQKIILGFEPYTLSGKNNVQVGAQLMISTANHSFWKNVYHDFAQRLWSDSFDILPGILTRYLEKEYSLAHHRNSHIYYYLKNGLCIYPVDVLYPPQKYTSPPHINTLCIHWEHSQQKHTNTSSWTNYLYKLKKPLE